MRAVYKRILILLTLSLCVITICRIHYLRYLSPEDSPEAAVEVQPYDGSTGLIGVRVSDFKHLDAEIQAVNIAVWIDGKEGEKKWGSAVRADDGSYYLNVDTAWFEGEKGDYQIEAYVRTADGGRYVLGTAEVSVE